MASQRHKRENNFINLDKTLPIDEVLSATPPLPPGDSAEELADSYGEEAAWPTEARPAITGMVAGMTPSHASTYDRSKPDGG